MRFIYWKGSGDKVIKALKQKENALIALAKAVDLNPDTIAIDFNKKPEVFSKWYPDITVGIVEESSDEIIVVTNANMLNAYINHLTAGIKIDESKEAVMALSNIYLMMAATVLSEYAVDTNDKIKSIIEESSDNEGTKILTSMYIAARIRMAIPEIADTMMTVHDPYTFMDHNEMTEISWRELFDIAAYYSEKHGGEHKSFWTAMCKKEPGKLLQKPNKIDDIIAELEKVYNSYTNR